MDGTLLGPRASLFSGEGGSFSLASSRALEACARAEVEVVLYSGRRQGSVFEASRLIGSSAYIFELGCGLVLDGELEWLTGETVPGERGTIYDQIAASGAPDLLLEHFSGRLEYHTPWSVAREVSHLFRGGVDIAEAHAALEHAGHGDLRLVDNGVIPEHGGLREGIDVVHAYHLIPASASKAGAVARHMQNRGYRRMDCIAIGDSREDMGAASAVGEFWLVANGVERDPSLQEEAARTPGVRICSDSFGAGVYEAVVSTLAERGHAYA